MEDFGGDGDTDGARTDDENVHVVVFDALVGAVGVGDVASDDSGDFVGGDAGTDAASAEDDPAFCSAFDDIATDGEGEVGVVAGFGGVCAHVDGGVASPLDFGDEVSFEFNPGVIGADGDDHDWW